MHTQSLLRRTAAVACVFALLGPGAVAGAPHARSASPTAATQPSSAQPSSDRRLDALPTAFEPNVGQTDARAKFVARGKGFTAFVTDDGLTVSLLAPAGDDASSGVPRRGEALRMRVEGARTETRVVPGERLPGVANYLTGRDPEAWRRDVPTYASVRAEGVRDGVDVVYYGRSSELEYDLVVAPGADPDRIRIDFDGQRSAAVDGRGDVALKMAYGTIRHRTPVAYQTDGATRRPVAARYALESDGRLGVELGEYDRSKPLVVDPVIDFADYIGGSWSAESAAGVAVDAAGHAYVVGTTNAVDFPTTPGAYQPASGSAGDFSTTFEDVFVTELDASGASAVYSTYLGGSSVERAHGIAVDASGAAYVVGETISTDFPVTAGAFDPSFTLGFDGNEGFVTKIAPGGGSLVYSSYVGGTSADVAMGVAVDSLGRATVAGTTSSSDFPTTAGAFDKTSNGGNDAFVARVAADGASLVYATYVGGSGFDAASSTAIDASGHAYVAGETQSTTDFPTTPGAYDTTNLSGSDAFVAELSTDGASLVYATFLGGTQGESAYAIAVDASGAATVAGETHSGDFPVTAGAYSTAADGSDDCFVTKVAAGGATLSYSSRFGGPGDDAAKGVALDASGAAYVVGIAGASGFPTTAGAFDASHNGSDDAFAAKLVPSGGSLAYSTYLGGPGTDRAAAIAVAADQTATVVGNTTSASYPTTAGALDVRYAGDSDAFVTKLASNGASLGYSTYLSGLASAGEYPGDTTTSVAYGSDGALYVAGATASLNFPVTPGAYDTTPGGVGFANDDAYVAKLAADGSAFVYSTFFGGEANDTIQGIAVTPTGQAVVGGQTYSTSFPLTPGAPDAVYNANGDPSYAEGFVTKLAADGGSLVSSTYVGGSNGETVSTVAVDASGATYAVGSTTSFNFPTTAGAFDTTYSDTLGDGDAFVVKISPNGTSFAYSTYLGGSAAEAGIAIAVDGSGAAYVGGYTFSSNFPTTAGAYDRTYAGTALDGYDGFVTKLAPSGASLVFSTFLGGQGSESVLALALDGAGAVYVAGQAGSDFPTTPGAFDTVSAGYDGFVSKLSSSGASLVYSTYVGGESEDALYAIAVDASGDAIAVGKTISLAYPTTPNALDRTWGSGPFSFGTDAVVTELNPSGTALLYSTYLGGNGTDVGIDAAYRDGRLAVAGLTMSTDFATTGIGGRDQNNGFVVEIGLTVDRDSPAVYTSAGAWFLKNVNAGGNADAVFTYGGGGALVPISGDWDGDGDDTPGLYDPTTGAFFLKNANAPGGADAVFAFGAGGPGIVPLAGDWNGDGVDTIGLYVAATGTFFLKNANASGPADVVFTFGGGGAGVAPMTGDWNGDGVDTIGLYVAATGTFFLKNANASGPADVAFTYGPAGQRALAGDWNGDGVDTVGVYVAGTGSWFLRNTNTPGVADVTFSYGPANVTPLVGNWDGR